jgi:hypothetical protein
MWTLTCCESPLLFGIENKHYKKLKSNIDEKYYIVCLPIFDHKINETYVGIHPIEHLKCHDDPSSQIDMTLEECEKEFQGFYEFVYENIDKCHPNVQSKLQKDHLKSEFLEGNYVSTSSPNEEISIYRILKVKTYPSWVRLQNQFPILGSKVDIFSPSLLPLNNNNEWIQYKNINDYFDKSNLDNICELHNIIDMLKEEEINISNEKSQHDMLNVENIENIENIALNKKLINKMIAIETNMIGNMIQAALTRSTIIRGGHRVLKSIHINKEIWVKGLCSYFQKKGVSIKKHNETYKMEIKHDIIQHIWPEQYCKFKSNNNNNANYGILDGYVCIKIFANYNPQSKYQNMYLRIFCVGAKYNPNSNVKITLEKYW